MLPISLVTGFLGSGKTTFLKRIVARNRGRTLVFLVNEFSPIDVDGHVLASETRDLVCLPGGSVFCTCLVSEFIGALKGIPERFATQERPVEGVVIEASGVADPRVVERMLRETHLDRTYRLASVICVVDPFTFPKLVRSLPNTIAQVESSDVVVLNKTDLAGEAALGETEAALRRIRADVPIIRAVHCDVDLDLFGNRAVRDIEGEYATCADPNFARFVVRLPNDVDLDALKRAIEHAKETIYRLKGYVTVKGSACYVDFTSAGLRIEPTNAPCEQSVLALIVRGDAYEQGRRLTETLKSTVIGEAPHAPR